MDEDTNLQALISGAIFDFAGFLTTRNETILVGSTSDAAQMVELITEWSKERNLSLNNAAVQTWQNSLDHFGQDTI